MRFLKLFLLLSLLLFPLGEIFRINVTNEIAIRPLDISVGITSIIFIIINLKNWKFQKSYLMKPLIYFSVIGLFSLVINCFFLNQYQLFSSSLYLIRWVLYSIIYFVIWSFDSNFKKIISLILIADGIVILLFGYLQYFFYPNLRNLYYLGWDEHNYRLFSVFLDPNFAGAFFVLFFIFLVGIVRFHLAEKRYKANIKLSIIMSITLFAVFLTYSRSAILMLIASMGVYLILINKKKLLYVFFGIIACILIILSPTFNKENTNLLRITSSIARIETYNNAFKIIKDHPVFGIGFNAYRYFQQSYGFRDTITKFPNHADAGVDSSLLFATATTGLVGLSAYLFIWYSILKKALAFRNKTSNLFPFVVICSTIGLFVNSIFINSLFFPPLMYWMWIIIGLMESN